MPATDPKKLSGKWDSGYALDVHTISSECIGYNPYGQPVFDTTRTELGDLLYRAKYGGSKKALDSIAEAAADFIKSKKWEIDCIVPVPPSNTERKSQPVTELADRVAAILKIPVCKQCLEKVKETSELKNVYDLSARRKQLRDAFSVEEKLTRKKRILLLDDLYRSGATLNEIAKTLREQGSAATIYVLTVTKTRSNS
jgi:competence protein ComFC